MAKLSDVLGTSFDSAAVEPREDFSDLLPPGQYTVEITDADVRQTKAGTGQLLKLEHTVIDPETHARRKLWKQITLANPNSQAEQIGRQELSGLCRAVGIAVLNDSDELIGKIVKAKVAIRKGTGGYADQNEIKVYESARLDAAAAAPAPKQPPARVNAKTAPWDRSAAR